MVSMKAGVCVTISLVLLGSALCDETVGTTPARLSAVDGALQSSLSPRRRHLSKNSGRNGRKEEKYETATATAAKPKGSKSGKAGSDRKGEKDREKGQSNICGKLDVFRNVFYNPHRTSSGKTRQTQQQHLDDDEHGCSPDGLAVARNNTQLSTFLDLLEFAGIEELLSCTGSFTILAPSNAAFAKNPDLLASLSVQSNIRAVRKMFLYHFVRGRLMSTDLDEGPLPTLKDDNVDVLLAPIRFNQAGVSQADIPSCNAVYVLQSGILINAGLSYFSHKRFPTFSIHIIDDILIPPGSPILPQICEFFDLRQPGQFPESLWFQQYFPSSGGKGRRRLQFQGERCRGGVLDTIQSDPNLRTFSGLLRVADLEDIFLCAGPFTVLAPVNDAFAKLDPAFVQELLQPNMIEKLRAILLYHILPKHRPITSFVAGELETLLAGANVTVGVAPLQFDGSVVVRPNMTACNGIIHSLNEVRMPSGSDFCHMFSLRRSLQDANPTCTNMLETASNDLTLSTVVSLLNISGLKAIFECDGPFTALLPSNDAFNKLGQYQLAFLRNPAHRNELRDILRFHILSGSTNSSMFTSGPRNTLLQGKQLNISLAPLQFDKAAAVNRSDIETCQGVIHILDSVLLPFALPELCDEYTFGRRKRQLQSGGRNCDQNILDVAKKSADLTIVTTLIDVAGLTPVFSCAGPFTAIFPSNTAFDDVPEKFLDELLFEENIDRLRTLLLHHILPGATLTSKISAGPLVTLAKAKVNASVRPLEFNGFFLFSADVPACNGYINVVSGLLNPF